MSESKEMSELEALLRVRCKKEVEEEVHTILNEANKRLRLLFGRDINSIRKDRFITENADDIKRGALIKVSRNIENIINGYETLTQSLSMERLNKEIEEMNKKSAEREKDEG